MTLQLFHPSSPPLFAQGWPKPLFLLNVYISAIAKGGARFFGFDINLADED
jgi:hypothetical protein